MRKHSRIAKTVLLTCALARGQAQAPTPPPFLATPYPGITLLSRQDPEPITQLPIPFMESGCLPDAPVDGSGIADLKDRLKTVISHPYITEATLPFPALTKESQTSYEQINLLNRHVTNNDASRIYAIIEQIENSKDLRQIGALLKLGIYSQGWKRWAYCQIASSTILRAGGVTRPESNYLATSTWISLHLFLLINEQWLPAYQTWNNTSAPMDARNRALDHLKLLYQEFGWAALKINAMICPTGREMELHRSWQDVAELLANSSVESTRFINRMGTLGSYEAEQVPKILDAVHKVILQTNECAAQNDLKDYLKECDNVDTATLTATREYILRKFGPRETREAVAKQAPPSEISHPVGKLGEKSRAKEPATPPIDSQAYRARIIQLDREQHPKIGHFVSAWGKFENSGYMPTTAPELIPATEAVKAGFILQLQVGITNPNFQAQHKLWQEIAMNWISACDECKSAYLLAQQGRQKDYQFSLHTEAAAKKIAEATRQRQLFIEEFRRGASEQR